MSVTETAFKLPTPVEGLESILELVSQTHWLQGHYEDRCEWLDKDGQPVVINGEPVYKIGYCLAGLINKQACLAHVEVLDTYALIGVAGDASYLGDEGLRELAEDWDNEPDRSFERLKLARTMGEHVWASILADESYANMGPDHLSNIEIWNDKVIVNREDVVRVLDRAIVAAKEAVEPTTPA